MKFARSVPRAFDWASHHQPNIIAADRRLHDLRNVAAHTQFVGAFERDTAKEIGQEQTWAHFTRHQGVKVSRWGLFQGTFVTLAHSWAAIPSPIRRSSRGIPEDAAHVFRGFRLPL
jgi:hypothetical protein